MTSQQTLHHQREHIYKVVLDFLALCVVICPSHRLCVTVFVSDWAAAGLCPRPDEASASPADREEPQRPHRPGELPSTCCPTIYPCYQTNSQQHSVIDGSCLWGLVENDEAALKHKRVWAVLVGWRSLPLHLRPCLISIDLSVLTSISYSHFSLARLNEIFSVCWDSGATLLWWPLAHWVVLWLFLFIYFPLLLT